MTLFQLSVSYRNTDDINRFVFQTFAASVRYGKLLEEYRDLLNGYTIRELVPENTYGGFKAARVLKHICWHLPQYAKLTYKNRKQITIK